MAKTKKVSIYSTPTCVFCTAAKKYFNDRKVVYEEYDVATDLQKREEMVKKSGQMGVPVIDINGTVIVGYDESKIEQLLK